MQSGLRKFYSRSHHAVIRVYDDAGNVIETRASGRFQRAVSSFVRSKSSALQMDNLAIPDLGEEIFVTHYEGSPNHS